MGRQNVWLFGLCVGFLAGCRPQTAVLPTATSPLISEGGVTAVPEMTVAAPSPATRATPPPPSSTAVGTQTPTSIPPTASHTPTITATPLPLLNGLTINDILIIDEATQANVRQIYANGQQWGRNPNLYSILGDSTVMTPHLLARFQRDDLNLGQYAYLQPTVDHFATTWSRFGVAVNYGLHSWSVFDPLWADKKWCQPEEDLLTCEFRLQNPAFLLVRLGSNDAGSPGGFTHNVRQVITHTIAHGIVPIIISKPDRFEGDNTNNEILRQLAADYHLPLWDLDRVAETLPNKGLDEDQVHMAAYTANDFNDLAAFSSGHAMQDLSGLMALHALLQTVQKEGE